MSNGPQRKRPGEARPLPDDEGSIERLAGNKE